MQQLLMGLIVAAAAGYAAWYWLPAAWRVRLGRVHAALARAPACGSCESSCGDCAKAGADEARARGATDREALRAVVEWLRLETAAGLG